MQGAVGSLPTLQLLYYKVRTWLLQGTVGGKVFICRYEEGSGQRYPEESGAGRESSRPNTVIRVRGRGDVQRGRERRNKRPRESGKGGWGGQKSKWPK